MANSEFNSSELFGADGDQEVCVSTDRKKHLFLKDICSMLYAFGDVENPLPETVVLLEEIAVQYLLDMTKKALEIGRPGKITIEDIAFLVRYEPRKFSRAKELLLISEELNRAKKAFENDDF